MVTDVAGQLLQLSLKGRLFSVGIGGLIATWMLKWTSGWASLRGSLESPHSEAGLQEVPHPPTPWDSAGAVVLSMPHMSVAKVLPTPLQNQAGWGVLEVLTGHRRGTILNISLSQTGPPSHFLGLSIIAKVPNQDFSLDCLQLVS